MGTVLVVVLPAEVRESSPCQVRQLDYYSRGLVGSVHMADLQRVGVWARAELRWGWRCDYLGAGGFDGRVVALSLGPVDIR